MDAISGTGDASMGLVFSLYDIGKGNEGKAANVRRVEGTVIGSVVGRDKVVIGKGSEFGGPFGGRLVVRTCVAGTRDRHSRGLMLGVRHDFDGVGVELVVRNGLGSVVENGGDVVFCLDVARDGRGVGHENGAVLDISLEDL